MWMWITFDNNHGVSSYVPVPVMETYVQPGVYLVQTTGLCVAAGTGLSLTATANLTGGTSLWTAASGT
jgi:hypothetical protein